MGLMGSGSFGLNAKDLPLGKDEYYELMELLVFYVMLPNRGFEGTMSSMKELPMPKDLRKTFEVRLVDLRNTAVADLKITNAERIISLITPSTTNSIDETNTEDMSLKDTQLSASGGVVSSKSILTRKRIKIVIAIFACLAIIISLMKSGLLRKVLVDYLLKSRIMRSLLLLLFNYRIAVKV